MTRQLLALSLLVLACSTSAAAQSVWRMVETTNDLTAAGNDRRLIVRADDWPAAPPTTAEGYAGATIVVACGDRIPNSAGRSLLFNAGQPLQPFGSEMAYAELRFDRDSVATKVYLTMFEPNRVTFFGEQQSPYFSQRLLGRLMAATTLKVKFRAFGGDSVVSFHVAGLRAALEQLPACHWSP